MGTKEMLQGRKDIPDDQVEELVVRAARLQDEARESDNNSASSSDVEAVAAELDIAPEFVEQAISSWRQEQAKLDSNAKTSRIVQRRKRIMRVLAGLGILGLTLIGITTLTTFSLFGWQGLVAAALAGVGALGFLFWLIT